MKDIAMTQAEINATERKADLTLLFKCKKLKSQGAKKDFCASLNCPWDEYLRLCRKYKFVLIAYRKEQENDS